jgi:hypothetical protein
MHTTLPVADEHSQRLSIVVAFAVLILIIVAIGISTMINCYCGRENEYTEIRDDDYTDIEMPDTPVADSPEKKADDVSTNFQKAPVFRKRTKPTPAGERNSADVLAQEIDYFVRHMEDFYATGFYCSVVLLENHISFADKWKSKSLREFLRKRPEFKTRSNMSAFKLTALTPFREPEVQVTGKFQCVNVHCRYAWRSLCSYADHFQKCRMCHAHVYPYEQSALTDAEIEEYLRNPLDENFADAGEIAFSRKRDAMDISNHTISPVRPTLSSQNLHNQSGNSLLSQGSAH